jgi:hypothetical protein
MIAIPLGRVHHHPAAARRADGYGLPPTLAARNPQADVSSAQRSPLCCRIASQSGIPLTAPHRAPHVATESDG